jgi:hypothetical protein
LQIHPGSVKLVVGVLAAKSLKIAGELMSTSRSSSEVFEQEFLPLRAKLLEVAAALDRLDRASGSLASDSRLEQVRTAIQVLTRPDDDRAEQIQLIFSRPYEDGWRKRLRLREEECTEEHRSKRNLSS